MFCRMCGDDFQQILNKLYLPALLVQLMDHSLRKFTLFGNISKKVSACTSTGQVLQFRGY